VLIEWEQLIEISQNGFDVRAVDWLMFPQENDRPQANEFVWDWAKGDVFDTAAIWVIPHTHFHVPVKVTVTPHKSIETLNLGSESSERVLEVYISTKKEAHTVPDLAVVL
jgi:hypothetical protein